MALLLKQRGITRVRPLLGGLDGWRRRGFPMAPYQPPEETVSAAGERR